ncbi:MAG: abortive infection protein [Nitrososphaerales archaeon]
MNRKGVCYDVGRVMMGGNWRPNFNQKVVHRELGIIKNDLHCNAVRICGLDIERLTTAAEDALNQGLEVWFCPEMWDRTQEETLEYITKAAVAAEKLRQMWSGKLVFSLGSELTLFMRGIVEGDNFFERMNNPSFWEIIRVGRHNELLNAFLARANEAVRQVFHGHVTYFSVPLETVDWSIFDFVGVDMYRDLRIKDTYGGLVKRYLMHDKPVLIGEFGCCTYQGAEKLGGNGFMIVFGMMKDHLDPNRDLPKGIAEMIKIPSRMDGHYVRDEKLQASELADQLSVLDSASVEGAFVFTFVSPTSPHVKDPKYDGDLASFSLVKSYAEKETVEGIIQQAAKQGREFLGVDIDAEIFTEFTGEVGKHGTTYPDMTWEPKESFRAVADYYSKH